MRIKNIFSLLFIAALLPVSYLICNPYGKTNIVLINEQRIKLSGRGVSLVRKEKEAARENVDGAALVSFFGTDTGGSRILDANSLVFVSGKTGRESVRLEFSAPIDLYKYSIVLFIRGARADGSLRLSLTDRNNFTLVRNEEKAVPVTNRWVKVVISGQGLGDVWGIDKSKITAIRLLSEAEVHGRVQSIEIKNIALRLAAR